MSDTPRTNLNEESMKGFYQVLYPSGRHTSFVDTEFARQLERELNAATAVKDVEIERLNAVVAGRNKELEACRQMRNTEEQTK